MLFSISLIEYVCLKSVFKVFSVDRLTLIRMTNRLHYYTTTLKYVCFLMKKLNFDSLQLTLSRMTNVLFWNCDRISEWKKWKTLLLFSDSLIEYVCLKSIFKVFFYRKTGSKKMTNRLHYYATTLKFMCFLTKKLNFDSSQLNLSRMTNVLLWNCNRISERKKWKTLLLFLVSLIEYVCLRSIFKVFFISRFTLIKMAIRLHY